MEPIEIHGFAQSTFVRTARMVCEEKGVPHRLVPLEFRAPSHRALHPFLRMPVMRAGELVLYETLAIASYVDDAFDGPRLAAEPGLARARMLQWISVCSDYLFADVVKALVVAKTEPSPEQLELARGHLEAVDRELETGPFLLGEELRLCDLFLAPIFAYAEQETAKYGTLDGLDGLARWGDAMRSRPSFQATQP